MAPIGQMQPRRVAAGIPARTRRQGSSAAEARDAQFARSMHPALAGVARLQLTVARSSASRTTRSNPEGPIDRVPCVAACTQIQPRRRHLASAISRPLSDMTGDGHSPATTPTEPPRQGYSSTPIGSRRPRDPFCRRPVVRPDRSRPARAGQRGRGGVKPIFSLTGRRILFACVDYKHRSFALDLCVMAADGTGLTDITNTRSQRESPKLGPRTRLTGAAEGLLLDA